MTVQEQAALIQLLDHVKPPVSLEIGTNRGGSLQVIAPRSRHVYALDINPKVPEYLGNRFTNVTVRIGDSRISIPQVLREIEAKGEELGFALIDGDHTGAVVKEDVNAVLKYRPRRPLYIVLHDSFNPDCRAGMLASDWQACPHVHYLQLDFVGGKFTPVAGKLEMWGGFGLALLLPEKRTGALRIGQGGRQMFETVRACSSHAPPEEACGPALGLIPEPQGVLHHLKGLCRALPGLPFRLFKRLRHGSGEGRAAA
jgi:hypothetical protein